MRKLVNIWTISVSALFAIFVTTRILNATIPEHLSGSGCANCHSIHSSPGQSLTNAGSVEVLCASCHNPSMFPSSPIPINHRDDDASPTFEMACAVCHEPHDYEQNSLLSLNLKLVRATVATPNSGEKNVIFVARGTDAQDPNPALNVAPNSFADADTSYDGICEVCHTTTKFHSNNGLYQGNPVAAHNGGMFCIRCHTHDEGFRASCTGCHGQSQDNGGDGIVRRAITGEFSATSHHVGRSGAVEVQNDDCAVCHYEAVDGAYHENNVVDLRDPDTGGQITDDGTPTGNPYAFSQFTRDTASNSLETWVTTVQDNFCLKCHDTDGASGTGVPVEGGTAQQPFSVNFRNAPNVLSQFAATINSHPVILSGNNPFCNNVTMEPPWNQTGHDYISCFDCHNANGHGSANQRMIRVSVDFDTMAGGAPTDGVPVETFCTLCHKSTTYVTPPRRDDAGSRYEYHGSHQSQHSADGGNDFGCMGCHGGTQDQGGLGVSNGAAPGNIHGRNFTWTAPSESAGVPTETFMLGGWISGWNTSGQCWGGTCNHGPTGNGQNYTR